MNHCTVLDLPGRGSQFLWGPVLLGNFVEGGGSRYTASNHPLSSVLLPTDPRWSPTRVCARQLIVSTH
jgi:hypothetical protein